MNYQMSQPKPLPPTKDGFRYCWGVDDKICEKYITELNSIEPNKMRLQMPSFIKRKLIPKNVKLSETDKAPQLKLNDECTSVTGDKGYCMVRATNGINRGKFYYEVDIDSMPENTAARIGWTQYYSNLQAPLGYDHYGYSWRSRLGTKFHQARGKTFDKNGGYHQEDTIGCMIELPYGNSKNITQAQHLPKSVKSTGYLVRHKKVMPTMLEERDEPPSLSDMKPLVGSKISFYRNGRFIGVAFEDIPAGFYYPALSLYKTCVVTVNFGPNFKFPPEKFNETSKNHLHYLPVNEMAEIAIIDNLMTDLLYVIDHELSNEGNKLEELVKKCIQGC